MPRSRYWKITPDEIGSFTYDDARLLHWEIKCTKEPEEAAQFIGVFAYKNGTPYDYESIRGICYYHNNMDSAEISSVTGFLHKRFGGKQIKKGDRIFLKESDVPYSGKQIGQLAKELEGNFDTKAVISLEFDGLTQDQLKESGLPEAKLLPIPGT